jgi:hypothetical protein
MKKIILIVGICVVGLLSVHAQQTAAKSGLTFEQKVDKMMKSLTFACALTADQATKIKPIVEEAIKARMANKQKYSNDRDQLKKVNQADLQTENAKMNAILNADQQAKLVAFEQQKKADAQKKNKTTTAPSQQ